MTVWKRTSGPGTIGGRRAFQLYGASRLARPVQAKSGIRRPERHGGRRRTGAALCLPHGLRWRARPAPAVGPLLEPLLVGGQVGQRRQGAVDRPAGGGQRPVGLEALGGQRTVGGTYVGCGDLVDTGPSYL